MAMLNLSLLPLLFGSFRLTDFLRRLDYLPLKFVIVLPVCCHFDFSSLTCKELSTLFIQHQIG